MADATDGMRRLVAGDGPLRERVPADVRLGFLPHGDLLTFYDRAAVLCMPSRSEGFGAGRDRGHGRGHARGGHTRGRARGRGGARAHRVARGARRRPRPARRARAPARRQRAPRRRRGRRPPARGRALCLAGRHRGHAGGLSRGTRTTPGRVRSRSRSRSRARTRQPRRENNPPMSALLTQIAAVVALTLVMAYPGAPILALLGARAALPVALLPQRRSPSRSCAACPLCASRCGSACQRRPCLPGSSGLPWRPPQSGSRGAPVATTAHRPGAGSSVTPRWAGHAACRGRLRCSPYWPPQWRSCSAASSTTATSCTTPPSPESSANSPAPASPPSSCSPTAPCTPATPRPCGTSCGRSRRASPASACYTVLWMAAVPLPGPTGSATTTSSSTSSTRTRCRPRPTGAPAGPTAPS